VLHVKVNHPLLILNVRVLIDSESNAVTGKNIIVNTAFNINIKVKVNEETGFNNRL
tara:strand:+ start:1823 stop:1990 length:168 start_codon:yes stop_codon:yes gene_type:complete